MTLRLGLAALAPLVFAACVTRGPVTRVADGATFEGRPIAPEAYAAYLSASVLEERGDARGALRELERALDEDPRSPEIVTRIARLLCARGAPREASDEALENFDDALALDPGYAPAWLGLAECRERRSDFPAALEAAERAAYFDPQSAPATRTVARLLFRLGRPNEAWVWLDALTTLSPESREAARALLDAAVLRRDRARERRARSALLELGQGDGLSREAALDDALHAGDLARARTLASALSLRPSTLAWRALDASSPTLALEQTKLVLGADPSDTEAWVVALAAADELGDEARFLEVLALLDPEPLPPSPRALELLGRLLARHGGPDAPAAAGALLQRKP